MSNQIPEGDFETNLQQSESGFVASPRLRDSLQKVLVNLIDLQLVGKQAHWNVVGPSFRSLHLNLDNVVEIARDGGDVIAERMRALHATPDGRSKVVSAHSTLPDFVPGEISTHDAIRAIVQAVDATVKTLRDVHDGVDSEDPATADILHEFIIKLEQQSWFLSAELRSPNKD